MASAAGDSRRNRALRAQAKRDEATNKTVIEALAKTKDGRRWLWIWLERSAIFVDAGDLDPQKLAYAAGNRHNGLRLLQLITRYTPQGYITMTNENTRMALEIEKEDEDDGPDSTDE